jgi:hypothetical protein
LRSSSPPAPPAAASAVARGSAFEAVARAEVGLRPSEPPLRASNVTAEARIETFATELVVLIKYGHAEQVPHEIERWIRTFPDALATHLRLAEFECERVDATSGVDRVFAIASRALDVGDRALAQRGLEIVDREAPEDARRAALKGRIGG